MKSLLTASLSLLVAIVYLSGSRAKAEPAYDPTSDLLLAFGDRCPMSYGNLNRGALADSSALQKIIDSIRGDPNCNGVTGALASVQGALNSGALIAPKADELALQQQQQTCQSLQSAFNAVSSALTNTLDPNYNYAVELQNELRNCQLSLVTTQSKQAFDQGSLRLQTAQNLQNYTVQLFQALNSSSKCVTKNPSIPAQVIGQVIGLSSTLVSTVTGLGLLSTSVLVDQLINYVKNYKLGSALKKLSSASQVTGINCAMEAIAESYCQSTEKELAMKANQAMSSHKNSCEFLNQSALINSNLTLLNQMINALKSSSGSSASSLSAQSEVNSGKANIQNQRLTLKSYLLSSQQIIPQEMENFQKQMIMALSSTMGRLESIQSVVPADSGDSGMGGGPSCNLQIYFYSKGAQKQTPPGALSNGHTCQDYLQTNFPTVPSVETNIATASTLLDNLDVLLTQKSAKIGGDSNKLLSDIISAQPISGEQYLNKVHTYLDNLKKNYDEQLKSSATSKSDQIYFQLQNEKVEALNKSIQGALDDLYKTDKSDIKAANILRDLTPNGDAEFLSVGLQDLIAKDLQKRIVNHTLNADVEELVHYSAAKSMSDLTGSLSALAETSAITKAQIDDSKRLSTENLQAISSVFGKLLTDGIHSMQSKVDKEVDPETYKSNIAKTCILMAQLPDPPSVRDCKGTKWVTRAVKKRWITIK